MKHSILFFGFLFILSCSEENISIDSQQTYEPDYLLESIILDINTIEFNGQYIRSYEYNNFNNPTFYYEYSTDGTVIPIPKLEFIYNNDQELIEIIEYDLNGENYIKNTFLTFNDQEAHGTIQGYDVDGNLMPIAYEFHLTFDNYLIKTLDIFYEYNGALGLSYGVHFEHDTDGKVTSITQPNVYPAYQTTTVTEWEDNPYPDSLGAWSHYLGLPVMNWFPKHYFSTKIPIINGIGQTIDYNSDGMVSGFLVEYNGGGTPNYYSKNYIPTN